MEKLDQVWDAVNVLGGRPDQDNSYDQGWADAIAKALDEIEKLGGMDPKLRPSVKALQDFASNSGLAR